MSGCEWKPGDVGISATDERFIVTSRGDCFWPGDGVAASVGVSGVPNERDRPLVVIDPEDREQVERLESLYLADDHDACENPTDCMADALRELANPTPPKPDEPTGLGAVVIDALNIYWTRVETGDEITRNPWYPAYDAEMQPAEWHEITAVRVLSEGVSDV